MKGAKVMNITSCRVNHLPNPLGFAMEKTVFSWAVEDARGKYQQAARILVKAGGSVVADTQWTELDSLAAPVEFPQKPCTRYTWTVAVRTDAGEEAVSEETGLRPGWTGGRPNGSAVTTANPGTLFSQNGSRLRRKWLPPVYISAVWAFMKPAGTAGRSAANI